MLWEVKVSKAPIDGPGLAMLGVGSILVYAGIKGYSMLALVGNLIQGRPIATDVTEVNAITSGKVSGFDPPSNAGVPSGDNRALGRQMAAGYGWDGPEWTALETLWTNESGWNNRADNPSSHAYGIPQAWTLTKMPKAAWPESEGGTSDARTQIAWGLDYIRGRYGSPIMALAFWNRQSPHWY